MPREDFRELAWEILQDCNRNPAITVAALDALQIVAERYLEGSLAGAADCATHRGFKAMEPKDIQRAHRIRGERTY